ncbi:MAG: Coenzyme F420 hydrogenase/dehydrogenase, beta subunit C-terminal domain [Clostridia bacterium]|nr:Coenzyme F420 hydrogenase/dehydrogenase, beta subunit C-terminal domain [Clostridia bacterium]
MKNIIESNKCTGCTACFNICPNNAISILQNEEGFYMPQIDEEKCVNCGLCTKICPVLNTKKNESKNKCFVAFNKDVEARKKSSSGGIFDVLAKNVINSNGIVIGAAFDEKVHLIHKAVSDIRSIEELRGSKYLQSELNDIFKYVKENVEERQILFVGTPCQVAGLKAFLKKDYNNLICVDVICHGTPSPKMFEAYVNEIEKNNNDKLIKYDFRDKSTGWETYSNTAIFKNKKCSELQKNNNYMKLFLSDIALKESCYDCNFKLGNKYSDITLGDFWGVSKFYPEMHNRDGVSAIIINTDKGAEMFENIKNELDYKECKLEEIVAGNPSLAKSAGYPEKRKEFFTDLKQLSFDELSQKYERKISLLQKIKNKVKSFVK